MDELFSDTECESHIDHTWITTGSAPYNYNNSKKSGNNSIIV
ncbi:unnamed protein product [Medioppia subpectinata]|uniref:Uncharacterized protein n=1 Tax=Medioppia subpectinata TaxID=1979941 RepID=A0A7R9LSA6_9ACAR|nr:unnamed protein product [Medioppia subpectinata]CAG2121201.1 unnamed protein product [Medioppia subpectinata]